MITRFGALLRRCRSSHPANSVSCLILYLEVRTNANYDVMGRMVARIVRRAVACRVL
jgi:hypothetical protein